MASPIRSDPAPALLERTKIAHVLKIIDRNIAAVAADAITINQIPAPTFGEADRASFLADRFASLGLETERGAQGDVLACTGRPGDGPTLLLQASLDTIFPETVNPTARVEGKRVVGPGIGDNALGLAALLTLAEVLLRASLTEVGTLVFAATAQSEGAGNVAGMRRLVKRWGSRLDWALCLRGHDLGRLSHSAVRTQRYRVRWPREGDVAVDRWDLLPDLLEGIGTLETERAGVTVELEPLDELLASGPHATDGVGVDLKMGPDAKLAPAARKLHGLIRSIAERRGLALELESVGGWERAAIPEEHPLVRTVESVHRALAIPTLSRPAGPDAAVALASGIPTVVLGITHGRNRHRENEWVELEPISRGLAQVFLVALGLFQLPATS